MAWDALYIGKVIYDACKTVSGVNLNVYPLRIPQSVDLKTQPAVVYHIVSNNGEDVKDSRSLVDTIRFQVSVWASSYTLATSTASLIREALDGLSGEVSGCSVDYMRFEDESDGYDDEYKIFEHVIDFSARVKNNASMGTQLEYPKVITGITGDYTWTDAVPAGYMVEYVLFEESAGETGQISIGTTAGTTNVMQSEAIAGGGLTVVDRINQRMISLHTATTLYINHAGDGDAWNDMNLTIYLVMRKIN
jgi:hypothetical protein